MTKPVIEVAFCDGCGKHLDDHRWIEGDGNLIYDPVTNEVFHPLCFVGALPLSLIAEYTAESAKSTLH